MNEKRTTTEEATGEQPFREATLPPRLAALRQKLAQKAKQEPKFRFYSLYGGVMSEGVGPRIVTLLALTGGALTGKWGLQHGQTVAHSISWRGVAVWVSRRLEMGHYTRVTQAISRVMRQPSRRLKTLKRKLIGLGEKLRE